MFCCVPRSGNKAANERSGGSSRPPASTPHPPPPPKKTLPLSQSRTMEATEGTRAPVERLLFTNQCVYLSRTRLPPRCLRPGGQLFAYQRQATPLLVPDQSGGLKPARRFPPFPAVESLEGLFHVNSKHPQEENPRLPPVTPRL